MNKFVKQVVNSVAVQAAVYAVTEGGKVAWPKAKKLFEKIKEKSKSINTESNKTRMELQDVIRRTETEYRRQIDEKKKKSADKTEAKFN